MLSAHSRKVRAARPLLALLGILALGLIVAPNLWAGGVGTSMPWNTPMQALLNNMTGPTARILVGIATAFSGYKWMFQSHEQGANNMARVTVGGAIALTAQTIISYASFGGALL
jgi:type IV secretory pathway VirB2 component (pilin)